MKLRITSPPANPVTAGLITVAAAKAYARVFHSAEDSFFTSYIPAAVLLCEKASGMSFLTRTIEAEVTMLSHQGDPFDLRASAPIDPDNINDGLILKRPPVTSITAFQAIDAYGSLPPVDLVAGTHYDFLPSISGIRWLPSFVTEISKTYDRMLITYVAGLDATPFAATYPDIIDAILQTVTLRYDHRGMSSQSIPPPALEVLSGYYVQNRQRRF